MTKSIFKGMAIFIIVLVGMVFAFYVSATACTNNADCGINAYTGSSYCQGNNVYQNFITYGCNNPGTSSAQCVSNTSAQLKESCPQGCINGACVISNPQGECTYHAYKMCVGNAIYWYGGGSCANQQQGLAELCSGQNMICKYGRCVYQSNIPPVAPYVAKHSVKCYSNNLYWFDSLGKINQLYKNCSDSNSCTLDGCASGKCSNVLKCDGSTCAVGSTDYNNYCATATPVPGPGSEQGGLSALLVSFFAKEDKLLLQWQKNVQVKANSQIYFMVSVANSSAVKADNVVVSANIPEEIASLGNLQVDGVPLAGDIVSGVNIGTLEPTTAKMITFEGKTYGIPAESSKQATVTVGTSGNNKSDTVSLALKAGEQAAATASAPAASGFWEFLKRWYLWILVGLVLIFLFFVVFKRLSTNA